MKVMWDERSAELKVRASVTAVICALLGLSEVTKVASLALVNPHELLQGPIWEPSGKAEVSIVSAVLSRVSK